MPIAYRKITKSGGGSKSNIDFAKDLFDKVREYGDCDVTVVDVSSFFESLDHVLLKKALITVLDRDLRPDEEAVFKAITNYSVVDIKPLFDRLGVFEKVKVAGKPSRLRKIDLMRKKGHKRLFNRGEFDSLVCGGDPKLPSLIQRHRDEFGIPQGTPLSDILANIYLIEFDLKLARWARKRGGVAFRYSDDIVLVLPRTVSQPFDLGMKYLTRLIENYGTKVKIKPEKVAIGRFIRTPDQLVYSHIFGKSSQNGIEYLGFQFDGSVVQIKNSTLINAWRKLKKRSRGWAKRWVRRYRNKGDNWLVDEANLDDRTTEVLRTMTMPQMDKGSVKDWTFISYVERASAIFSDYETKFDNQTLKYRRRALSIFEDSLTDAIERHGHAKFLEKGGKL